MGGVTKTNERCKELEKFLENQQRTLTIREDDKEEGRVVVR